MKFRRKTAQADPSAGETPAEETLADGTADDEVSVGPFDIDELDDGVPRLDLGSLLIVPGPGHELRLQVADQGDEIQAVVLAGADGAVEMRAFAAPRNGDLWSTVRPKLAADVARRGGIATEQDGPFGPELLCELSVAGADGKPRKQVQRIVGVNGPRWMLRATILGRPATDPVAAASWEETISKVAVRRGEHAMPVGDALPFAMPRDDDAGAPGTGD